MARRLFLNGPRNYVSWVSSKKNQSPLIKNIIKEYDYYTPKIIDSALNKTPFTLTEEIKTRIKTSVEYYLLGRNPVQGEFMVFAHEQLNNNKKITDELLHQLQVIVATVEMVQTYYFFSDDFEDDAKTRLGKTCWHLLDDNGILAFNDACVMRSFVNEIIRQNFVGELREHILSIFNTVYFTASIGQYLDAILAKRRNYNNYTIQQYNTTCTYKSTYYSVKLPILLALAFNNKLNPESYNNVEDTAVDIGILIQIHNDLMDYLISKGKNRGKTSNDIQLGKCSWVAVAVLERCNPEQRGIFTENFGSCDPEKVKRIHQLYDEMNVEHLYDQEKQRRMESFEKKVKHLPENSTPSSTFFKNFSNVVYCYSQDTKKFMYDKY